VVSERNQGNSVNKFLFDIEHNWVMPKSGYVTSLDEIQRAMTAFLKPLGFRKSGRAYNRAVQDGLVHVVGFQMGEYPIGQYAIPGTRESFYGRFTVNLGIMLPAVRDMEQRYAPNHWIRGIKRNLTGEHVLIP
jgi:Domain of unknown function (DUF4304)